MWRHPSPPLPLAVDTFTAADGTTLEAHASDDGGSWTRHAAGSGVGSATIENGMVHNVNDGNSRLYFHSILPASADYAVEADVVMKSDNDAGTIGPVIRCDPTAATFYHLRYSCGANGWQLFKFVAGAATQLGATVLQTLTVNQVYRARLSATGSQLRAFIDGLLILDVTDTAIAASGHAGLRVNNVVTTTTGLHIDAWRVIW
jgi:hypothetical protein